MRYFEAWQGSNGNWLIYEVTEYGQHWVLVKTFKTRRGAENWAKRQWLQVNWR